MFDFLFSTDTILALTLEQVVIAIGAAVILGVAISLTYIGTNREERSVHLPITLLVLPAIVATVIMLIGNNIAGAFSLAGIFSIVKFRSIVGNAKEIVYVLFCVAAGLATGVGEYAIGFLVTCILCALMFIMGATKYGKNTLFNSELKILMPENEDAEQAISPVLDEFAESYKLSAMRTKDLGSVFEVAYLLKMKNDRDTKSMIDALRVKNGNLKISVSKHLPQEAEF